MIHDATLAHGVHYLLEWAALATGAWHYRWLQRQRGLKSLSKGPSFALLLGCLLGAAIGNKAVYWVENPHLWAAAAGSPALWLQGQSIVGGLLGGWLGVEAAKRCVRWQGPRTGDDFVPAILLGLVIGRLGCFLAGLHDGTYGLPTSLPWGIDLGDGIPRHPAPLYELLAAAAAWATWPRWRQRFAATPGLAFRVFMLGYLLWRVGIDHLKPVPYRYAWGASGIQWVAGIAAAAIAAGLLYDHWQQRASTALAPSSLGK